MTLASGFGSVHNFFHSSTWYVMRNLAIFFVLVFWIASIYWVNKDARRRIHDPLLVWVATLLGVVPFIGPLIYMLFRPPEYIEDVRERELEIKAMEKRLGGRDQHCPVCRAEVEEDFLICPVCTTKLRQSCVRCHKPLEALWQVCPYCETPIEHDPTTVLAEVKRPPRRSGPGSLRRRMAVEQTLILAKPDAVQRGLAGEILARFERRGLTVRGARLVVASRELGEAHYAEHAEKPFFGELVDFISSGPTLAFVLEGEGAIATCRLTIGATNPAEALPGSLRGQYALAMPNNLVHGSDSTESAQREIGLWFPDGLA